MSKQDLILFYLLFLSGCISHESTKLRYDVIKSIPFELNLASGRWEEIANPFLYQNKTNEESFIVEDTTLQRYPLISNKSSFGFFCMKDFEKVKFYIFSADEKTILDSNSQVLNIGQYFLIFSNISTANSKIPVKLIIGNKTIKKIISIIN